MQENINKLNALRDELAGLIYSFDLKVKFNTETEVAFITELQKSIIEGIQANMKKALYTEIDKLNSEGKTPEEIKNGLKPIKSGIAKRVTNLNSQLRMHRDIKNSKEKYTFDQIKDLDNRYAEVIRMYHPLITFTADQISITTFNTLRQMYMISNIDGFENVLKDHPIPVRELPENLVEKAIETTVTNISKFKEQLEKANTVNRFDKMAEELKDEAALGREEAALRQQNYKIKQEVQVLENKIKASFDEATLNDLLK